MTPAIDTHAEAGLLDRRRVLTRANDVKPHEGIQTLIADVDAALDRCHRGTYGLCDVCHEDIGEDRLAEDPVAFSCREHPSPAEVARLQRDLTLARSVQRDLLPRPSGTVGGWTYEYHYQAAGDVGGDFCDVLSNPRGSLILVGDVSGKGVAASLLMSSLLATARSLFSLGLPAGDLLARVNALFHDTTSPSSYATLAAASLHPDGQVDLYSAGHWPPLIRRGPQLDPVLITPDVPIGLFPNARYTPTRLQLDPGDTLLFFTDGAIDAENAAGEDYGRRRLAEALATADGRGLGLGHVLEHCLRDLARFQSGRRADDDVMLMAIRRGSA